MAQYIDEYREGLGNVIGTSITDLDGRKDVVRKCESNLGNLTADSWFAWFTSADIALVNAGSIRGDKMYPVGPITYLIVNEILPFRNEVWSVKMSGADLRKRRRESPVPLLTLRKKRESTLPIFLRLCNTATWTRNSGEGRGEHRQS